jgi:AraC-like DNA-binding protein
MDVDESDGRAVGGRIQKVVFASKQLLGRHDGSNCRTSRGERDFASDGSDHFCVALHKRRSDIISIQNGQEVTTSRDTAVLLTAEPGEMLGDLENGWYAINISRARLLALVPNADDLIGKPLDASSSALRHLGRYVEFLIDLKQDSDPALDRHIETTLVDLIALALGARRDPSEIAVMRGLRAARLQDVLAAIKSGFHEPEFSSQGVAQRLGLSRRYVNDLLAESGSGFAERVLEMRLDKARGMLMDAAHDRLKVSEIAWTCGFNEVPYFNRRFRRRFGMTPTERRESARCRVAHPGYIPTVPDGQITSGLRKVCQAPK